MGGRREHDVALATHTARVLEWGEPHAPLVVALHGFPDTAATWRHLGPALAERGYRVAAPFLRGYAPSGIPADGVFTVGALMADAAHLHAGLGGDERAVLVGHDWGAITASGLAAHPGSPFRRVVTMAVPPLSTLHPSRVLLGTWLGAVARQPRNSWYMLFNQLPGVAEGVFWPLVDRLWRDWSPGYDAADDLAALRGSVPDREHARAVLSYYRHLLRPRRGAAYASWGRTWADAPVVPTLSLHGERDGCLDRRFHDLAAARLVPPDRAVLVPGAGHFLHLERPGVVGDLVAGFCDEGA